MCNGVWSWIWGWIIITIDSVIRGYHIYKDVWESQLHWRNVAISLCTWFTQPSQSLGLLGQVAKYRCPSLEVFEQRLRIKKSSVWNCETSSELKWKCKSNCRIKICEVATACIVIRKILGPHDKTHCRILASYIAIGSLSHSNFVMWLS